MGSAKAVAVLCFLATAAFAFLGCRGDLQNDADAVNLFLQTADPRGILRSRRWNASNICNQEGVVSCDHNRSRVERFKLQSLPLNGSFADGTLDTMAQLRYLTIIDCGLSGPLPDLSQMHNLKHLYLDRNNFSGDFPPSIATLHRLAVLSLSVNSLSGELPQGLAQLPHLLRLNLQQNKLSGSIPAFNQTNLYVFNVSYNNFSGQIPDTPTLQRFNASSFQGNSLLCGNLLGKSCTPSASPEPEPEPTAPAHGPTPVASPGSGDNSNNLTAGEIVGIVVACVVAVWAVVLIFCYVTRKRGSGRDSGSGAAGDVRETTVSAEVLRREEQPRMSIRKATARGSSVDMPLLSFCGSEVPKYTLEDLLKASAEVLGRGTLGTSYKAVMEFMLIVAVKRLRYIKGDRHEFENYVESIGELRHPNLVPLRAYFQAKEERLIVFDYEPNGSLANLIYGAHHGSKGRPLHLSVTWRVAEDVARGLWFLHETCNVVHGNMKPSNVLMGRHSEARLVDYALTPLYADKAADAATSLAIYRPPESKTAVFVGPKADAYAYGVILLEMLAGEPPPPALLLNASVSEIPVWARAARADPAATAGVADGASIAAFDAHFSEKVEALIEVALRCVAFSPAQRPSMATVLGLLEDGWDRSAASLDRDDVHDYDRYSDRY